MSAHIEKWISYEPGTFTETIESIELSNESHAQKQTVT